MQQEREEESTTNKQSNFAVFQQATKKQNCETAKYDWVFIKK
ncbi:MAG: hypothetical protein DHS20C12_29790 [Pseudohongiella sp.]|nr:MAG: hypothetical protein DHS20C12_29790 [Pseudohongiella sp.]